MTDPNNTSKAVIRAYPDGPILVRGAFELEDEDGNPIDPRRSTVALCRCGKSGIKPFCDGTHAIARSK
jgi:CDGSH-type Zn-finger protein